jgi:acetyl esterase/lipase
MRRRLLGLVVVCVSLVLSGCDLHHLEIPGEGPTRYRDLVFDEVTTTPDLVYGNAPDQQGEPVSLTLDLYRPTGDDVTLRPAIVWVHGGYFATGDKTSPEIVDEATTFARKGYVNASINYRVTPGGCISVTPACLTAIVDAKHDAQAAVRYLRANATQYGVDPGRIAIAGTSAGAITALNVGYGPEDVGDSGNPGFSSRVRAAVSLSGARALTTPSAGEPPALLFHGTADPIVPHASAVRTVDEATAAGLTAYLTSWDGAGHVPYVAHRTTILAETTNFLYWTLDLANAAR